MKTRRRKKMSDAAMDLPPRVKKEQVKNDHITLRVKDQDQNEVFFRIKKSIPLKILMDGYCVKKRVELRTFAFLFDGKNLRPEHTIEEAGLEDGDEIDVLAHQLCGGYVG